MIIKSYGNYRISKNLEGDFVVEKRHFFFFWKEESILSDMNDAKIRCIDLCLKRGVFLETLSTAMLIFSISFYLLSVVLDALASYL